MQKITLNLWFDTQAEEAANFYVSTFKNGNVGKVTRYGKTGAEVSGQLEGSVLTVEFELFGHQFIGLNGGPIFKFTPAISFMVNCATVDEVNEYWEKLIDGGTALMPLDAYPFNSRYGWVQDKYGLSWQILLAEQPIEQKIVPALMYIGANTGKAEEAINFYTAQFENSSIGEITRYSPGQAPDAESTIAHARFTLAGQHFAAMDSGRIHNFTFTEAVSLMVSCDTQEEIDRYWNALSAVPESEQCGWLKDTYGVSWQITPKILATMVADPDPVKAERAMQAMLQMKKLDIAKLEEAYRG